MFAPKKQVIYSKELPVQPISITAVETSMPVFIGYTQKAEENDMANSLRNIPTYITSLQDFLEKFGSSYPEAFDLLINDIFNPDGKLTSKAFSATLPSPSVFKLFYSLQMYFNNGGGPCYIVSVGDFSNGVTAGASNPPQGLLGGIAAVENTEGPTLLLFPDAVSLENVTGYGQLIQAALAQCAKRRDRFMIADVYDNETPGAIDDFKNSFGSNHLEYGAVYYPYLKAYLAYGCDGATPVIHNKSGTVPLSAPDYSRTSEAGGFEDLKNSAPAIYHSLVAEMNNIKVELPSSGAIAGIYAKVDNERGVWKAPANVALNTVIEPVVAITDAIQEKLNVDPVSGKSINAIRQFAGRGILVWGARTMAGNDNDWRYISVKRFFIFVEESVKKSTQFVVFEPNDVNTWSRIKAMIADFLTGLWRRGALAGNKPEEAFFVKAGLGETMTSQDILEGRLIVMIGMATLRPAEFIIIHLSYELKESAVKLLPTQMNCDDLVQDGKMLAKIQEIETWLSRDAALLKDESRKRALNSGYKVLFYGAADEEKTLAAARIGKKTGREVYRIDLSQIISKYIGETEKNMTRIFDKADNTGWILLFDEADALFGRRTEVKDAHDRYANIEMSYLWQKIEAYPGLIVLAFHTKQNIDKEFIRRFQTVIHFPNTKLRKVSRYSKRIYPKLPPT